MKRPPRQKRPQAAAICWRIKDGEIQFLLIATQKQHRWIFPKGKIEKHESLWETAKREAQEEAKVKGKVFRDPVFELSRKTSGGRVIPMSFFLLRWKRQSRGKPRDFKWVAFEEACGLLKDGRDNAYGRGLEQALKKGNVKIERQLQQREL